MRGGEGAILFGVSLLPASLNLLLEFNIFLSSSILLLISTKVLKSFLSSLLIRSCSSIVCCLSCLNDVLDPTMIVLLATTVVSIFPSGLATLRPLGGTSKPLWLRTSSPQTIVFLPFWECQGFSPLLSTISTAPQFLSVFVPFTLLASFPCEPRLLLLGGTMSPL